jgi:hypothetical protein
MFLPYEIKEEILRRRSKLAFKDRIREMEGVLLQHPFPTEFTFDMEEAGFFIFQARLPEYDLEWTISERQPEHGFPGYYKFEIARKPLKVFEGVNFYLETY